MASPNLNRASWTVVVADSDGQQLSSCAGPVWAHLPHTSPVGELCGLVAACQLAKGVAKHLYVDYMCVAKSVSGAGFHLNRRCGIYTGILRTPS